MTVEKRKWGGRVSSRWIAHVTSEGGGRLSWRTPMGTVQERPERASRTVRETQHSAATGGWFVATRLGPGHARRWKIDAATPTTVRADAISFVDLDLDVVLGPGHRIAVHDLGQFATRAWREGYPPALVVRAVLGVVEALARAATRRWPFDGSLE